MCKIPFVSKYLTQKLETKSRNVSRFLLRNATTTTAGLPPPALPALAMAGPSFAFFWPSLDFCCAYRYNCRSPKFGLHSAQSSTWQSNKSCASCGLIVLWGRGGGSSSPSADFVASAHWEKMTSVKVSELKSNFIWA